MSFSQSLSLGDNTLNELDVCENNVKRVDRNVMNSRSITSMKNASSNPSNTKAIDILNQSTSLDSNKMLEVIDESPTEKMQMLGKSIRERLQKASASRKSHRKYMRRSRSDPITTVRDTNNLLTDSCDSMFNFTTDDLEQAIEKNNKTKVKLDERFENDDFDKYFDNIKTPKLKQKSQNSSLMILSDSDEEVGISKIEQLMRTDNQIEYDEPKEEIKWEDSAFFADLPVTQTCLVNDEEKEMEDSLADYLFDAECVSLQNEQKEVEKEMESCFLEVSIQLSHLNATQAKTFNRMNTQLDTSVSSRNIPDQSCYRNSINKTENINNLTFIQPNKLSIDNLVEWNCSQSIIKMYKKMGIQNMFEWQAECLSIPSVKDGHANLLYSAPTSAGKTFVSEILMLQTVLKMQKKVIVILPFISVVREKMYYLQDLLRSSGIRVEGFFGGYTATNSFESTDIAICTIEKANAIVNRLLELKNIDSIGMIVVDEIHMISDPNRGYILEILLTKILYCSRKLNANIQIVAMSATLPNAELLQNWLDAQFYLTNYRPIELFEMIKIGQNIHDKSMNLIRTISNDEYANIQNDPDNIAQMCIETIVNAASVIVFCPSKDWCESLALHVSQNIYKLGKSNTEIGAKIRKEINMPMINQVKQHLQNSPAGLDSVLEKTVSYGVAFHHAGLTFDERDIIESSFCKSSIRVIIATSTLSSGVNLPARRVIIRSPMFGGKPMCPLTYKQMIGRAGRMGKDTEGESILICANNNARIGQELIGATLKPIKSCLSADNHTHLKRAILEIIASDVATTRCELEDFVKCTMYYYEHKFEIKYFDQILLEYKQRMQSKTKPTPDTDNDDQDLDFVGNCMRFLGRYEFIRLQYNEELQEIKYVSTRLGYACLSSSMPPSDGFFLFSELQRARQSFVLDTELHAVYLVTPFSVCYQLQDIDWLFYLDMWEKLSNPMQKVGELVGVKESFLVKAMRNSNKLDNRTLQIHKRFYTAIALHELINECPLSKVASKYKLSRGTLQTLQQTASTFAGIVKSFCKSLNWDMLALIVSQFQDRIFFGVHQDLVDLMKISILNGQRARALFSAGYQTLVDISKADVFDIEKCLIDSISFDVQKRDGETNYDAEQRNKFRQVFVTGRDGLSIEEAARLIINEAREYIVETMGIKNVNWSEINNASPNGRVSVNVDQTLHSPPDQQHNNKRKIPDHVEVAKSAKRSRTMIPNENSSNESMSEFSDNEPIIFDNSITFYNDEHDEFMEQLTSNNRNVHAPRLHIVNVTETIEKFDSFVKSFENVVECGLCLSIVRTSNASNEYCCIISRDFYLNGVAFSFQDSYTVHFLSLQNGFDVDIDKKIKFIQKILSRRKLTLQINDAKTQLKTIMKAIPTYNKVKCSIEDPQIAQWLIQPEDDRTFCKLITQNAPNCLDLSTMISQGSVNATTSSMIRSSIKACITRKILKEQSQILSMMGNGSIYKAFKEMEMPIQTSLLHMEQVGMALNRSSLDILNEQISEYLGDLEKEIYRLNGKRFAINSSKQVAQTLRIRKKNGSISAKCNRTQLMQCNHPIAKHILEHRSLNAILSKSIQPLIKKTNEDNRIYSNSYSFTQTGRISMHEPNLQNVAKDFHTEFIPKIFSCRSAFTVRPDRVLVSADFCQLELRVLAHLSEDDGLIGIFNTLNDVFLSIAAKWNKTMENDVTEKMRNDTKQICYGIIYGMSIKSMATTMKCDEEEATSLYESFHQAYPGIRCYTNKILGFVRKKGYVETIAGRRRYIPDININHNVQKRAKAERQAINTTIQGSAADIAKYAILRMERNLSKYQPVLKSDARSNPSNSIDLVLHLHDELLYEAPIEKCNQVVKILKSSMENCAKLLVPLRVKVKKGQSWGKMTIID